MAREKYLLGTVGNCEERFWEWVQTTRKTNAKFNMRYNTVMALWEKVEAEQALTFAEECKVVSCIVSTNGTGKMEGIPGCPDTSCLCNQFCNLRVQNCHRLPDADPDDPEDGLCICDFCYSGKSLNNYDPLNLNTYLNGFIMTHFDISQEAWGTLPITAMLDVVRGEMHGDSHNILQVRNNLRIVYSHPQYGFTFWGKNLGHWRVAFEEMGKPKNLIFVVSSTFINRVREISKDMLKYVDYVFTVFSKRYVLKYGITINCGTYEGIKKIDHKCRNCMRCYTIHHDGDEVGYINELLK